MLHWYQHRSTEKACPSTLTYHGCQLTLEIGDTCQSHFEVKIDSLVRSRLLCDLGAHTFEFCFEGDDSISRKHVIEKVEVLLFQTVSLLEPQAAQEEKSVVYIHHLIKHLKRQ